MIADINISQEFQYLSQFWGQLQQQAAQEQQQDQQLLEETDPGAGS